MIDCSQCHYVEVMEGGLQYGGVSGRRDCDD